MTVTVEVTAGAITFTGTIARQAPVRAASARVLQREVQESADTGQDRPPSSLRPIVATKNSARGVAIAMISAGRHRGYTPPNFPGGYPKLGRQLLNQQHHHVVP